MKIKIIKIIIIIFLIIIPIFFFAFIGHESKSNSKMPAIVTFVIMVVCTAVWKYKPETIKENDSSVNQKQAKRNICNEKTKDGITLEIHTNLSQGYTVGDEVFIDGQPAPTKVYKLGWMSSLCIQDGMIKSL